VRSTPAAHRPDLPSPAEAGFAKAEGRHFSSVDHDPALRAGALLK
jgi:hypothetical protein